MRNFDNLPIMAWDRENSAVRTCHAVVDRPHDVESSGEMPGLYGE